MTVRRIAGGTTDVSVVIRIVDSTDGTPETGVVFNSAGIDLWYRRESAASVDITEATLSALTDAHADGGFLHINDGWYRLDLPDAACAAGVSGVQIGGAVTGMVVLAPYVELDATIVNVTQISGSSTAADTLEDMMDDTITEGAAVTGTLSTTQMTTNLTEATNDHYNGLVLTWTSGALLGQATTVTDYDGSTKMLTFVAVTEAPANGDTFALR